jgi:MFS family permease
MDRFAARWLVTVAALAGGIAIAATLIVPSVVTIGAALVIAGIAIGVGMTAAYSLAGQLLPPDAHVTGFGLLTTASLIGLATSPVIAGFLGASGLSLVFLFDVVLMIALAALVWAKLTARAAPDS